MDDNKFDLIMKELERIFEESLMDCTDLERYVVHQEIAKIASIMMTQGKMPSKIHRIASEIMHKYWCLQEGLEKK